MRGADFLPYPSTRRCPFFLQSIAAAVSLGLLGAALPTASQAAYPDKPVTFVTTFSTGSGPDAILRMVAERLGKMWGQPVNVENKPGGGGFLAIDYVQRAEPNGYTMLELDSEQLAALPHLYKKRQYDPLKTFEPVATIYNCPFLVVVPTDSPWKTMSDVLAAAKAKPGSVTYGSWGIGSPAHLGSTALEDFINTPMSHVPYKEIAPLFAAVANHEVNWSFASIPSSQAQYKAGKLRYIAVAAPQRIPQMPDVPTVAESGGPANFSVTSFIAIIAPKGLPVAIRDKVNADFAKVIAEPEIKAKLDTFAFQPINWSPDEIRKQTQAKSKTYQQLIEKANVTLD